VNNVARKQPTKPGSTSTGKPAESTIDRDKLRAAIRLGDEYLFYLLVIELLPPAQLAKLVRPYLDVKQLCPDARGRRACSARSEHSTRPAAPARTTRASSSRAGSSNGSPTTPTRARSVPCTATTNNSSLHLLGKVLAVVR